MAKTISSTWEKQYKDLLDAVSDGVAIYKPVDNGTDFIFSDFNKSAQKIDNIKKDSLIGKRVSQVFPGVKEFGLFDVFKSVYKTGQPEFHPVSLYKDNRITGWRENHVYKLPTGEIVAVYKDLTKHQEVQTRLQDTEKNYKALMEQMADGLMIIAGDPLKTTFVNQAAADILGHSIPEMLDFDQEDILDLIASEDRDEFQQSVIDSIKGNDTKSRHDLRAIRKDKTILWLSLSTRRVSYKSDWAAMLMFKDITQRKKATEDLEESKERLGNIINTAAELIVSTDRNGLIVSWNKAIADITGIPESAVYQKRTLPKNLQSMQEMINSSLRNRKSQFLEHEITDREGSKRIILSNTSLIKRETGEISGAILIGRDISLARKTQNEMAPGSSYISTDDAFPDICSRIRLLTQDQYNLLCITRGNYSDIRKTVHPDSSILILSERANGSNIVYHETEKLLAAIEFFITKHDKAIVVVDRLDFILYVSGHEKMIKFLYRLNDMIAHHKKICIIRANTLEEKHIRLLQAEFRKLPTLKEDTLLDKKKIEILKYISNKNAFHLSVPLNYIGSEFKLSRMTTKNRIEELVMKGFLQIEKQGRAKHVFITSKGKDFLSQAMNSGDY